MSQTTLINCLAAFVFALAATTWFEAGERHKAEAQEAKRYFYKIVDVPPDNVAMQSVLNEYGAAGWELVVLSMGDMTQPRLIFKK